MTTEVEQARGAAQALHVYLNRLERLAEMLARHGLRTSLLAPPGRVPSLHVVNPAASALAEDVYAGRGQDGRIPGRDLTAEFPGQGTLDDGSPASGVAVGHEPVEEFHHAVR